MLVYEKKVAEGGELKRHLFGTLGNIPADADVQLTYKDNNGSAITPVANDKYVDNGTKDKVQRMKRLSDDKGVNVFIGDTCIIGDVTNAAPVVQTPAPAPAPAPKAEPVKAVEVKKVEEPKKEEVVEDIKDDEEVIEDIIDEEVEE